MPLKPESSFHVTAVGDWLACLHPDGVFQRIARGNVHSVYFEAGDGAFDPDWWIVEGPSADDRCTFPLGATGETEAIEWLKQLAGFQIQGMNSVAPQRLLCWRRGETPGADT